MITKSCKTCKHYENSTNPETGSVDFEYCNAPNPVFLDIALRKLECFNAYVLLGFENSRRILQRVFSQALMPTFLPLRPLLITSARETAHVWKPYTFVGDTHYTLRSLCGRRKAVNEHSLASTETRRRCKVCERLMEKAT